MTEREYQALSDWADSWMISIPELLMTAAFDSEYCPDKDAMER